MNDGSQMGSQGTDDGWNLMAEILSEEDVGIGMLGDQLLVYVPPIIEQEHIGIADFRSRDPHDPPSDSRMRDTMSTSSMRPILLIPVTDPAERSKANARTRTSRSPGSSSRQLQQSSMKERCEEEVKEFD